MNGSQVLAGALKHAKNGPPVKDGKNPGAAFLAGFLGGPFGVGLYLESFEDFAFSLTALIIASVLTGGIAAPVAWMFCGIYGAVRVNSSKRS